MKNIIENINLFENTDCTVLEFNKIFNPKLLGIDQDLLVEIGELADTDTTRFLNVGSLIIKYNFTPKTGTDKAALCQN